MIQVNSIRYIQKHLGGGEFSYDLKLGRFGYPDVYNSVEDFKTVFKSYLIGGKPRFQDCRLVVRYRELRPAIATSAKAPTSMTTEKETTIIFD